MNDPLSDIRQYSEAMTISQVLKFCEKKDVGITRGMVQNYIRDGLMPSPVGKRYYTHKHLAALVMIDRLKTVFDMPTIQKTLVPFMDDEGLPLEIYNQLTLSSNSLLEQLVANVSGEGRGNLIVMAFLAHAKADVVRRLDKELNDKPSHANLEGDDKNE